MSLEEFQLLDDTSVETSIIKRAYMKLYHQQGAEVKISNQSIEKTFGEKNNYQRRGNACLEFDITLRKNRNNFDNLDGDDKTNEPIRLVNNAFAYFFSIVTLCTTGGEEIEVNKHFGHIPTTMRFLTNKRGYLP